MRRKRVFLPGAAITVCAVLASMFAFTEQVRAGSQLVYGWNNVGYYGAAKPPSEALSSIDGKYNAVYRWNAQEQKYELYAPNVPGFVSTLSQINTGDAIWVNLTAQSGSLPSLNLNGSVPTSGHVSVAASTFLPTSDLAVYEKTFNELYPVDDDDASERYYAPVVLPDGARVTNLTAAFEAQGGATVHLRLDYTPITNGSNNSQVYKLAEVLSSAGSSPQATDAFAHTVDNGANVYFLVVDLVGGAGAKLRGVSIAYDVG